MTKLTAEELLSRLANACTFEELSERLRDAFKPDATEPACPNAAEGQSSGSEST